ncbi:amino acid racemase [Streptomyces sioyaensis]|uniref:Amino acid racemase n=1 Tax=Streptomyces sioyaensis TaxID=67364 RepID=A0A4Q1R8V0_9ACTN|nr:amino acid racemase [Streptomyces sioyaensis]MBM4790637.1 amino acid racemase [Streptomyces sioyaensis]RXS69805.1 amino acid racemase [Streptomyces sioyaensis]
MAIVGICIATIEGGVVCHQEIGREAARRGIECPEIVTHTPKYEKIGRAIAADDFSDLGSTLADSVNLTAAAGADFAIIPSNTMHAVFDEVVRHAKIPVLSIIDSTAAQCRKDGYRRVGVLGTTSTAKRRLYDAPLASMGIEVVYPSDEDQDAVSGIISNELTKGVFLDESRRVLESVAHRVEREVDAILLGCTELPLVMNAEGFEVPCVDTTRLLSHAALDMAYESWPG